MSSAPSAGKYNFATIDRSLSARNGDRMRRPEVGTITGILLRRKSNIGPSPAIASMKSTARTSSSGNPVATVSTWELNVM